MNSQKSIALLILICFLSLTHLAGQAVNTGIGDVVMPPPESASLGKYNDIPVGYYTGVPNIGVPIHTVQDGSLTLPISLSYHASGVRIGEPASWVGTSWSLMAGGMISRTVQGLPDEGAAGFLMTAPGDTLDVPLGGLPPDCDCPAGSDTISNETDYCNDCSPAYIPPSTTGDYVSIANGALDGEPDIFSYNVGGFTGKFYFRPSGEIIQIPLQDVKIESGWSPPTNGISWFRITTPSGVQYTFGDQGGNNNGVERLSTGGTAPYVSGWKLTRIEDPNQLYAIDLQYTLEQYSYHSKPSWTDPGGASGVSTIMNIEGQRLSAISTSEGKESITFVESAAVREDLGFAPPYYTGIGGAHALDTIKIQTGAFCKAFVFQYDYFEDNSSFKSNDRFDKRLRLDALVEQSCDGSVVKPPYQFAYYKKAGEPDFLPNRLSPAIDHWGYYNGEDAPYDEQTTIPYRAYKIPTGTTRFEYEVLPTGDDRETHEEFMLIGNLKRITYPTGGAHQFEYEANEAENYEGIVRDSTLLGDKSLCPGCNVSNSASTSLTFTYYSQFEYTYDIDLGAPCNAGGGPEYVKACIANDCIPQLSESSGNLLDLFDAMTFIDGQSYTINIEGYYYCLNSFKVYEIDVWTTKKVGGLRVKKITANDAMGQKIMKTYEYAAANIPGLSSGYLFNTPKYWGIFVAPNPSTACYDPLRNQVRCHGSKYTIQHYSYSITPMSGFDGNHVVYSRVKEHHYGKDSSEYNGAKIFDYFTDDTAVPPPYSAVDPNIIESFPFAPSQANIRAGNLSAEYTVENANGAPVAQEIYTPKSEVYTSSTDKIVKATRIQVTIQQAAIYHIHYKIRTRPLYRLKSVESSIDGVSVIKNIDYDSPYHYFPTAEYFINSDGKEQRTETSYAADIGNANMVSRHMIGIPLEVCRKVDGTVVGGSKTEYNLFSNSLLPQYQYEILENDIPLLRMTLDYFADGKVQSVIRRGFAAETYTWQNDLPATKTFLNFNWSYQYFPGTRMLRSITDIKGLESRFQYDPLMRLKGSDARNGGLFSTYKYHYTLAGGGDPNYVEAYTSEDNVTRYNYLDGLGRPLQTLSLQYGPGQGDVVHGAVEYDAFGRVERQFQPHPGSGTYQAPGGPHDRFEYEASPLSRELRRIFADGTSMRTEYASNTSSDAVTNYQTSTPYADSELYKVTVYDEKGHPTTTFKDKIGRVILIRKKWDGSNVDTYYQYDDRDNLKAVMPPGCSSPTDIHIGYQYTYDERNRMKTKKLPGAGQQTFNYNDRDEVVSSIDGNGNVVGYEYDGHGRDTLTLLQKPSAQQPVPIIYKQYDGPGGGSMGELVRESKSILNGNLSRLIVTGYSYDQYGRVERMTDDAYRGGSDNFTYQYEAATDRVSQINRNYGAFGWTERYLYDHIGREKFQIHKMTRGSLYDSKPAITRGSEYDIKDQLVLKSLDYLQTIGYGYDVRGRLTRINKLPLAFDPAEGPVLPCGGGGGGENPNDSTQCGGQEVNMEVLLDLISSDEALSIDCYEEGCPEENDPVMVCNYSSTFGGVSTITSINDVTGAPVISFAPPLDLYSPNATTILQSYITNFLDTYGYDYTAVTVLFNAGSLSISITETDFQFYSISSNQESDVLFDNDCEIDTSFPTGTPTQSASQALSLQGLDTAMANMTIADVQFPTTIYSLNLYEGKSALVFEQELDDIEGEKTITKCKDVEDASTTVPLVIDGQVVEKSVAEFLSIRQDGFTGGSDLPDTVNCDGGPRLCYFEKTYSAKSVLPSILISDSLDLPPLNLADSWRVDFSLVIDGANWVAPDPGELAWDLGINVGSADPIVEELNIEVVGTGSISPFFNRIGLHNGLNFIPFNNGQYFTAFNSSGSFSITPDGLTSLSAYHLNNLRLVLYTNGDAKIDGIRVNIKYEAPCESCIPESPPCTTAERQLQAASMGALQNSIQTIQASQITYPTNLSLIGFCDGTKLYVLDSELSLISGSYAIFQEIEILFDDQFMQVYSSNGVVETDFIGFLEIRRTNPNALINGGGCPVKTEFEEGPLCTYRLYEENWQYENIPNSAQVKVLYDEVVKKTCESGIEEETSRIPSTTIIDINKTFEVGADRLWENVGYIDYLKLKTKNPEEILTINLNPSTLLNTYPKLAGTIDPNDLIFSNIDNFKQAVEYVINYAIKKWEEDNGLLTVKYTLSITGGVASGNNNNLLGNVAIGFRTYHQPTDPYICLSVTESVLRFSRNGVTFKDDIPALIPGSEIITAYSDEVPCGLVGVEYLDDIIDTTAIQWDLLPLNPPSPVRGSEDPCSFNVTTTYTSVCDQPKRVWNGSEFEECDYCTPDPPECSVTDAVAQRDYIDSLKAIYLSISADSLSYPDSLHQVMLCDGTLTYIFGQHLENLPGGGTIVQSIPVGGSNQTFEVAPFSDTTDLFAMRLYYEPNGNVEKVRWQVKYQPEQQYVFEYDDLDRMEHGTYSGQGWLSNAFYSEDVVYKDGRGNISRLTRGGYNGSCSYTLIDDLVYTYDPGNKVTHITDLSNNDRGFKERPNGPAEQYRYDANANMVYDWHKGIDTIGYNYLNLPGSIILEGVPLDYLYDAAGKKHRSPGPYDYVNNVHYSPDGFEAVYTDEGRVTPIYNDSLGTLDSFQYEWVIRDHLGNGRVYFSDLDKNLGISSQMPQEVLQERHYYPFGLMYEGPFYAQVGPENEYTYNGKRFHREGELNWYDYGARWQDPATIRWWSQDPLAGEYYPWTPYNYVLNNPFTFIDPDGRKVETRFVNEQGETIIDIDDGSDEVFVVFNNEMDNFIADLSNNIDLSKESDAKENAALGERHGYNLKDHSANVDHDTPSGEKLFSADKIELKNEREILIRIGYENGYNPSAENKAQSESLSYFKGSSSIGIGRAAGKRHKETDKMHAFEPKLKDSSEPQLSIVPSNTVKGKDGKKLRVNKRLKKN